MQTFPDCVTPIAERLGAKMLVHQSGATNEEPIPNAPGDSTSFSAVGNISNQGPSQDISTSDIADEALTIRVPEVQDIPLDTDESSSIEKPSKAIRILDTADETQKPVVAVSATENNQSLGNVGLQDQDDSPTSREREKKEVMHRYFTFTAL